jgi:predicted RNA polymerase sigma factor
MDNDATGLTALQAQHLTSDIKVTSENMGAPIALQDNDCRKWRHLFITNVTVILASYPQSTDIILRINTIFLFVDTAFIKLI